MQPRLPVFMLLAAAAAVPAAAQTWAGGRSIDARVGFAAALAISGDELLVGRTGSLHSPAGTVHVFRRDGTGVWREAGRFSGQGVGPGDDFGAALASDAGVTVVGAPGHGGGGAAFVFERMDGSWQQVAMLAAPDGAGDARFGAVLALRDGVLAVAAPARDAARGAVYLFRRDGAGRWSGGTMLGAGSVAGDRFGAALATAAGLVLAGVPGPGPGTDAPGQPRAGHAVLYHEAGGAWREAARLAAAPGDSALMFGSAVALLGDVAVIGAPLTALGSGAVFSFQRTAEGWTASGRVAAPASQPGQAFGTGLVIEGGRLVVGASGTGSGDPGAAHVFEREGSGWKVRQALHAEVEGARFGESLALAGDLLAVAGPGADFGEGTGWIYRRDRSTGSWRPEGSVSDGLLPLRAVTGGEIRCAAGRAGAFECSDVDLLAHLPNRNLGAPRGINLSDIWGWTDPETGREYALVGRMDATVFVDVTDPASPRIVGDLPMPQGARANFWRDIKTYRDHAFIVADGAGPHGMQVFDLTRLRNVMNAPVTFTEDAHYDRIASAHNIAINEETGFAYAIGSNGGGETCGGALHMIDIRDPKQPVFAGCFADRSTGIQKTGYTHDNQCVTYHGP
ncbi:MAG TPA: choice-of-anchor B family protein, partial [Gemmatimonadales bacterium]|nr:choice-of-anchor B family protein [Gemmatimonadales bacterium]